MFIKSELLSFFLFNAEVESKTNDCVYTDKKGNIMIKVSAKPGSKNSELTGETSSF